MKLEAVIVCKDYSDFLAHTLPENIQHFDHVVVVTHYSDKATQSLCSKWGVDCVQTHAFHEDGDKFNKGRAINVGLAHLKGLGHILHLDADILLPHRFRYMLQRHQLDNTAIYGADRVNILGYDRYLAFKQLQMPSYSDRYFVEPPPGFPLGTRFVHHEHGYCPIGYFQLWHKDLGNKYPTNQGTAEHTDVLFAIQWHRKQRILLPELFVYHLDSEPALKPMGANWQGRRTPPFGPKMRSGMHPNPPLPYTK